MPQAICREEGCGKQPHYGFPKQGRVCCAQHKQQGMERLTKSRKCQVPTCDKQPHYGHKGGSRTHCASHKHEGMILLDKRAKCLVPGCGRQAKYRFPGKRQTRCALHRSEGMQQAQTARLVVTPKKTQKLSLRKGPKGRPLSMGRKIDAKDDSVYLHGCHLPLMGRQRGRHDYNGLRTLSHPHLRGFHEHDSTDFRGLSDHEAMYHTPQSTSWQAMVVPEGPVKGAASASKLEALGVSVMRWLACGQVQPLQSEAAKEGTLKQEGCVEKAAHLVAADALLLLSAKN